MTEPPDNLATAERRRRALQADLKSLVLSSSSKGKTAYFAAFFFMVLAVLASIVAALGGIFDLFGNKIVGSLALIPGVISIFPTSLKLQARASWHYRKKDAAQGLLNEIEYGVSDPPLIDEIKAIAAKLSTLNIDMGREWETALAFTVTGAADRADGLKGGDPP